MPENTAAWLVGEGVSPLQVGPAPYTSPGPHEIVIKNAAIGISPLDVKLQKRAIYPLDYPKVLGEDVAGEVVEVGAEVSRFHVKDRVCGSPVGAFKDDPRAGYQHYTIVLDNMATIIPSSMPYEDAAVFPLAACTASCGLFQKEHMGLQHPSLNPRPTGQVVVIWAGSSSVGSSGVQLAAAAGYEVVATASPKNFDYVKKLGASQVFDYKSASVINDMAAALKGKQVAGLLDCVSVGGASEMCVQLLNLCQGTRFMAHVGEFQGGLADGVGNKRIFGSSLKDNDVGKAIWEDYLPQALARGKFAAAPGPLVVGMGLGAIQDAIDMLATGLSAQKAVVTL